MSGRINSSNNYKQGVLLTETLIGYSGKAKKIEVLSSYEFKAIRMIQQLFQLKRIDGWANEESIFQYKDSIQDKNRRYFMDFTLTKGEYTIFVEVKPAIKLSFPKKPKQFKGEKSIRNYRKYVQEYMLNQDKWKAVKEWCETQNILLGYKKYKFVIWTEETLSIK